VKNWKSFVALVVMGSGLANPTGVLRGQTVERDTTITGPRGRSIQRQVQVQRSPGSIDREVTIKRPGGTFERQVDIQRSPIGGRGFLPGPWPRPPFFGPRPLIIGQPAPAFGVGLVAAPFMNFSFGGGGMGGGGGGGAPGGPGAPPPPDQVALMCQRLQGFHLTGRKEAAYTLGQLGDPRAVPTLVHVLKYDNFKDVRIASAIALGEIGGSEAAVALEKAAVYDHREDVKKAASTALERLNAKAKAMAAMPQPTGPAMPPAGAQPSAPASSAPSPFRDAPPEGGPTPATGDASPAQGELSPPPPPTPVTSGDNPGGNR
jgi:hypothetical protein